MDTQLGSFSAGFATVSLDVSFAAAANGSVLSSVFAAAGAATAFSGREGGVFHSLANGLANGGDLDARSGAELLGAISGFASAGVSAFPQAAPFLASNLARYGGSQLFAGLAGYSINGIVQKFQDALFRDTANNLIDMAGSSPYSSLLRSALNSVDLSVMNSADRGKFLGMLAFAAASGGPSLAQAQALLKELASTQGSGWGYANALSSGGQFSYQITGQGTANVDLGDGYTLRINQANSEMDLVDNNTGHTTTIWGDPHMGMDGNNDQFQFKQDITLNLPDGTKITVQTTPWDAGNGAYVAQNLVISRGDQALVVNKMDQNSADLGQMSIQQYEGAGAAQVARLLNPDGTELYLNAAGNGWDVMQGGLFLRPMTEQDLVNGDQAHASGAAGAAWSFGVLTGLLSQSNSQEGPDNAIRFTAALAAATTR